MPIDLKKEQLITLAQGARLVPSRRDGKSTHLSTLVGAILKGNAGVKLEALRIGGRWVTSVEAIQRWAEQQTAARIQSKSARSRSARDGQNERAERRLDELGL
jgi:hypothetical protein